MTIRNSGFAGRELRAVGVILGLLLIGTVFAGDNPGSLLSGRTAAGWAVPPGLTARPGTGRPGQAVAIPQPGAGTPARLERGPGIDVDDYTLKGAPGLVVYADGIDWGGYSMGFAFTPQASGNVTRLGRYDPYGSSHYVELWDAGNQALLASAWVSGPDWAYTEITPIPITAGHQYAIGTSSGATVSYGGVPSVPLVVNDVSIDYGCFTLAQNAYPGANNSGSFIYGMPDFYFASDVPPPPFYVLRDVAEFERTGDGQPWGDGYSMGFVFTPQRNGDITKLGRFDPYGSSHFVELWDVTGQALLASTWVSGANWAYADITPVAVLSGHQYAIGTSSGATVSYGDMPYVPLVVSDISVDFGCYAVGQNVYPNVLESGTTIYGMPDFYFPGDNPAPTLSSISPTSKTAGDPEFELTVNGTNFVSTSVVQFAGSDRATTYVSQTRLTAVIPASDLRLAGTFGIRVFNPAPGGGVSNPQMFTVNNPEPTTSSISPDTKTAGDPEFEMTVSGTSFVSNSVVRFAGSDRATTFVSPVEVKALILAGDLAAGGTFDITVFNPVPGGGSSNPQVFTVNNRIPATSSIDPTSKAVGDPGFDLTVNGANFVPASVVRYGGSDRVTTFVNANQVTAAILASDLIAPRVFSITVFNPTPGGGLSNPQPFSVNNPAPLTSSITPASKMVGDPGFDMTVNGTGFVSSSVVELAGSVRTTTFVSPTELTAAIPASDMLVGGLFDITVFNPMPGGGASNPQTFTVNNAVPTTTRIQPSSRTVGDPGFAMTVDGTNFVSTSVVRLAGSDRLTTFVSPLRLTAWIPASDQLVAGTFDITVFNPTPGGGVSNPQPFTVNDAAPLAFNLLSPPDHSSSVPMTGSLVWDTSANAVSYDVYFGTPNPPPSPSANVTGTSWDYGTLNPLTGYQWYIVARNAIGSTTNTGGTWDFTTLPNAPGGFDLLTPANHATDVPVSGMMTWGAASGATSYEVYYDVFTPPLTLRGTAAGTAYNYSGLTGTTQYYWRVVARNAGGSSQSTSIFDFVTGFAVTSNWTQLEPMPAGVKAKNIKEGGNLTYVPANQDEEGGIFAFKGNNRYEFYQYNLTDNTWAAKESIPAYNPDGKKKTVKKGSVLVTGTDNNVYASKGNNTVFFWKYEPGTGFWAPLPARVPYVGTRVRGLKEGTGAVPVRDYLYLLKGSGTTEFYRWKLGDSTWEAMAAAPLLPSNKPFKNGSRLAYDGDNTIYALKGSYNTLYAYDIALDTWVIQDSVPKVGSTGKKKKVKDGSGMVFQGGSLYVLKGGNTNEFFSYDVATNTWSTLADMPVISTSTKKVKGGGALASVPGMNALYAFRGNNTLQFWSYGLGTAYGLPPTAKRNIASESEIVNLKSSIMIAPNPFANATTIAYSLPRAGNVSLKLYDVTGTLVTTLAQGYTAEGSYTSHIDATRLARGIYVLKFATEGYNTTRKLVLE